MSAENVVASGPYHDCRDGLLPHPEKSWVGRVDRCECGRYWQVKWYRPFEYEPKWRRISARKAARLIARSRHGEPS